MYAYKQTVANQPMLAAYTAFQMASNLAYLSQNSITETKYEVLRVTICCQQSESGTRTQDSGHERPHVVISDVK